ncbi:SMC-Scp complex subunit ScpB [Alkalihalobacillus deserti]|uniref:SMC-Scp complex subunit ScpB n=1 Tax=Alkalihalobacillus deserti TaxID=2879466 RepID=UPI001D145AC3|nr:SMC-Scp complex subunit ScpB [Alkalihalobacillus deserti]
MTVQELQATIEGLLFVAGDEGLTPADLATIVEIEPETISDVIYSLQLLFKEQQRGLQIVEVAGAFRLTTKPEHAPYFKKMAASPLHSSLSQAALETLAIIAYRQPITRMEIDEIRGVKSDRAIHSLSSKLLIKEVDRAPGPGRPILYGTTKFFLDHFGLKDLEELPPLPENIDESSLEDEADLFFKKFEATLETE